jgi:hypothetical protein
VLKVDVRERFSKGETGIEAAKKNIDKINPDME